MGPEKVSLSPSYAGVTYDFTLQTMQVDDQVTWRRLLRTTVDRATELTRKWMKENPEVPTPNTTPGSRSLHLRSRNSVEKQS
jgi:hypothetical protein